MISDSIHGIHVRFNHNATMNGNNRRVIFLISQFCNFFDSIFSHLAFAEQSQNIKSRINIAVMIDNHSQLIAKYSSIQATVNQPKIQTANHSASVILYIKTQIKTSAIKLKTSKNLNNATSNLKTLTTKSTINAIIRINFMFLLIMK